MPPTSASTPVPPLREQLVRESSAMVRRLATNGIRVPASVIQATDQFETALEHCKPIDVAALAATHDRLSRLVAPARPGTLSLLDASLHRQGGEPSSLGPVKLVRDLVRVSIACVAVFIALSVVSLVDAHAAIDLYGVENQGSVPAEGGRSDNHTLLVLKIVLQRVFWLAAAGIGASFAMLFALSEQITARTFDPDEAPSYWVKFFLGLVAGFILVALVPMDAGSGPEGATTGMQALGPPTIALLGGFSASAVYRILTRMVEALESVFTGGAREQAAAAEKAATVRAGEESAQTRMAVAGQLVDLQQQLSAGLPPDQAAAQLRQVVAALVPASSEFAAASAPAGKVPAMAVVADPADVPPAPAESAPADDPAPAAAPAQPAAG